MDDPFHLKKISNSIHFHNCSTNRDKTEELKKLTPMERQEIKSQDNARNGPGSYDRASRRRERALKIYVDSSPKKNDD